VVHYDTTVDSVVSGDTVVDISGTGVNGTLNGDAAYSSTHRALTFDGTGDISSTVSTFSGDQPHTMSVWVYISSALTTSDAYICVLAPSTGEILDQVSTIRFQNNGFSMQSFGNDIRMENLGIQKDRWYHLIAVYDGGGVTTSSKRLYINGVQNLSISTDATSGNTINFTNTTLSLGSRVDGAGSHLKGSISNFKLWDVALTAEEVAAEYALGRTGKSLNLTDTALCLGGTVPRAQLDVRGSARVNGRLAVGSYGTTDKEALAPLDVRGDYIQGSTYAVGTVNTAARFGSNDGTLHVSSIKTSNGAETLALQTTIDNKTMEYNIENGWTYGAATRYALCLQPYNGNVGIGTTSPAYTLDVHGTSNVGTLTATSATVPNDGDFVMAGKPLKVAGGLHWDQINSRLGVGTDSPTGKLQIRSGPSSIYATDTASLISNAAINISSYLDPSDYLSIGLLGATYSPEGNNPSAYMQVQWDTTVSPLTSSLLLNPIGGNVGIGTTNPASKLHIDNGVLVVEDTPETNPTLLLPDGDGTGASLNEHLIGHTHIGVAQFVSEQGADKSTIAIINKDRNNNTVKNASIGFYNTDTAGTGKYAGRIGFWPVQADALHNEFRVYTTNTVTSGAGYDYPQQRFVINKDGDVGIGTTNPGGKLHISNAGAVYTVISDTSAGTDEKNWWTSVSGSQMTHYLSNDANNASQPYMKINRSGYGVSSVTFDYGNVGIGTASPGYALTIRRNTNTLLLESENAGVSADVNIDFRNYDGQDPPGARITATDDAAYGSHLYFSTRTGAGSSLSERLRITSGGNVGIGTATPGYKLDVVGTVNTGALTATSATVPNDGDFVMAGKPLKSAVGLQWDRVNSRLGIGTNSPGYTLEVVDTIHSSKTLAPGTISTSVTRNDAKFLFYDIDSTNWSGMGSDSGGRFWLTTGTAGTRELFVMDSSGQVGIGTASPSYKLDVAGDIYATGNVTAYSDIRKKKNLQIIETPIEKVKELNGYTYEMEGRRYTGLVAQEVLKVLPEAVVGDEEKGYALAYGNMAGLLVEAIKELESKLAVALARLDALEAA
jgi:hypothetical protein